MIERKIGPPTDVAGECNAHLCVPDDWDSNEVTFRCNKKLNHLGTHRAHIKDQSYGEIMTWIEESP